MFIPRRFAPPLSKGDGCRTTYLPHISHHAASHAAIDVDKDPPPRPPLFKGTGGMQKSCPPSCKPCRNRCGQRPATATSPFQRGRGYAEIMPTMLQTKPQPMQTKTRNRDLPFSKGPGVCRRHAHHAASHAAIDVDKDPQPRPPLFKGAGGMQKTCPPHCQPCCNRCRQRPATATSPYPHNPVSVG